MRTIQRRLFTAALALIAACPAAASDGDPIAIRRSDGCFVIESMWNLSVQIVTADQFRSTPVEGVDLLRTATEMPSLPFRARQNARPGVTFDKTLDRPANENAATWTDTSRWKNPTPNAIRVRAAGPVIVIDVDAVRVTFIDQDATQLDAEATRLTEHTDVLIVGPAQQNAFVDPPSTRWAPASRLVDSPILVRSTDDKQQAIGNTLAVSSLSAKRADQSDQPRRTVLLDQRPLTLPVEMEKLMTAKEAACSASQAVFAKLSVEQMNFRPGNGTHTPRWNAEHMMGRELLFFSQIYAALDSAIPVMDLNPEQMPPDYVARHPDWSGAEEARQMQRVSAFTSRFAYLLEDLPLDAKAPGSNWTLRGLLRQMDRHYSEHTANTKKKFDLPEWPKE